MTENKDKEKHNDKEHERSVTANLLGARSKKSRDYLSPPSLFREDVRMYRNSCCISMESIIEVMAFVLETGEIQKPRSIGKDDHLGTQKVYKKTSSNSVLTLYLPTRELISYGAQPATLKGIVFVDPKIIQGCRVYAQLTLTFRYGREDEEVMGLRFCNEAIMSLHQIWPRNEEPNRESLTPLQDALMKRLGEGAFPFTLNLTPQAPPSVQLVPAKRYYGAPIGTSYDVRCFIADKMDEKFHRRVTVKMAIRVIHRTDVYSSITGPVNFTALVNNQTPVQQSQEHTSSSRTEGANPLSSNQLSVTNVVDNSALSVSATTSSSADVQQQHSATSRKPKKSERGDSFPRIRLSPKTFRFSHRFGRSKSEVERGPNECFFNYSKSFQEYDTCGGPQGAVDKPFLLQEGRVGLRASLDKSWYTHGEDVLVTVNIKNDSKKTVRKLRVCAIQHVDVCMFNNGKFKNVVADSDAISPCGTDKIVGPGGTLNATIILKPQRGPTKNWIALEDSLQRSSEPDEITGVIAASAVRPQLGKPLGSSSITTALSGTSNSGSSGEDRNVFAIYVSYYVKVKLTLSGMGGELSLKLPFALVHIDPSGMKSRLKCDDKAVEINELLSHKDRDILESVNRLTLSAIDKRLLKTTGLSESSSTEIGSSPSTSGKVNNHHGDTNLNQNPNSIDNIESIADDIAIIGSKRENFRESGGVDASGNNRSKRKLRRHETIVKNLSSEEEEEDMEISSNISNTNKNETRNLCNSDPNQEVPTREKKVIDRGFGCSGKTTLTSSSSPKSPPQHSTQQTTCVQIHATSL